MSNFDLQLMGFPGNGIYTRVIWEGFVSVFNFYALNMLLTLHFEKGMVITDGILVIADGMLVTADGMLVTADEVPVNLR